MSAHARHHHFWTALRREVALANLVPSLIISVVVAMMTIVLSVSFVAYIFVEPITAFRGDGTSLMLITAAVAGLFMAVFSSFAGTIAIPQDRVVPIVALMAGLIIQQMGGRANPHPETIGITVLAAIAVSAVLTGLALFLLGVYRLGNVVRFIPYPVIGGFLAGSGWLLLTASFQIISGQTFFATKLGELWTSGVFAEWVPCAIFGAIAYLAVRFSRHYLTLPALVIVGVSIFYFWLAWQHLSLASAREHGWIVGTPPNGTLRQLRPLPALIHADWGVILHQYGTFGALMLTSVVSILLNTTALELAADEEIDLNKELRAAGLANLFGGFAGGMVGFQSLSLSSLPITMGVRSRLVGLFSAFMCLLVLWLGTDLLGFIPRFILGGILFYNGLALLTEWVVDGYFRLWREDYLLVILILAIVAVAGYLQGVGAGILIATVLFVVKYSTVNVISYVLSGDGHHSTVDRSPVESRLLSDRGSQIYILRLKGFIFFGSANNLLNTVRERTAESGLPRMKYLILDFQHVSGLDTSGLVSLSKLSRLARREGFTIVATSVPVDIQNSFHTAGLTKPNSPMKLFRDRDYGIEWCENEILREEMVNVNDDRKMLPQILQEAHPWRTDVTALLRYLERMEVDKNHYLILQGDPSNELYFIESGKVKVMIELDNGRAMRVRTMGPGTVVGEIGLYLEQHRVASVVTEESAVVYRLSAEALRHLETEEPALASAFHEFMVRVLAERVTQQNRTLRALVD